MAPKKAKTAIKSKNSPEARFGRAKKMFNGKEVVMVRMINIGATGRKTQSDVVAYKEDSLTGKPSMFVMDGDKNMLWSKLKKFDA
ncbi:MAG: hypothetical protein EBU93_05915 [Chlamydiae bacterium]|nr:hypothetical protein [Chlamydiota bacterium]